MLYLPLCLEILLLLLLYSRLTGLCSSLDQGGDALPQLEKLFESDREILL
jgi:hypothetical protein